MFTAKVSAMAETHLASKREKPRQRDGPMLMRINGWWTDPTLSPSAELYGISDTYMTRFGLERGDVVTYKHMGHIMHGEFAILNHPLFSTVSFLAHCFPRQDRTMELRTDRSFPTILSSSEVADCTFWRITGVIKPPSPEARQFLIRRLILWRDDQARVAIETFFDDEKRKAKWQPQPKQRLMAEPLMCAPEIQLHGRLLAWPYRRALEG